MDLTEIHCPLVKAAIKLTWVPDLPEVLALVGCPLRQWYPS